MATTQFDGFPPEAIRFYDALAADNTKAFWTAHRATYENACRDPMRALLDELAPEFGVGKMHRPNRDIRFSYDKSPYRTNLAALVGDSRYIQLSAEGLFIGGGRYEFVGPALAEYREAVASDAGTDLATSLDELRRAGYEVGGEEL